VFCFHFQAMRNPEPYIFGIILIGVVLTVILVTHLRPQLTRRCSYIRGRVVCVDK